MNHYLKTVLFKFKTITSKMNTIIPKRNKRIVLYSNWGFRDNLRTLYQYLVDNGYQEEYEIICASNNFYHLEKEKDVKYVSIYRGLYYFLTSKYFFYSFGKYPIKPAPNQMVVNLWHGMPLKKIGNLEEGLENVDYNFFTKLVSSSDYFTPIMKAAFNATDEQILLVGNIRNDELFEEEKDKIVIKKVNSSNLLNESMQPAKWNVYTKTYLNDVIENSSAKPNSFIEGFINQMSSHELNKLDIPFDYAKPSALIKFLMEICKVKDNDIVLDFFSGSSSTADAVMQLNSKNNNKIKYIMVQLPERINENQYAYTKGYKTICDIGEERIRRAAKKIKEETNADIDYGFRVYKVDSSNMKDVYYEPSKLGQQQLNNLESNIKDDRTPEDLLTQVILDLGLTLDLKIEEKEILNNKVYFVAQNNLVACFDNEINIDIIDQICKTQPLKVVFRESSFKNDSEKINTYERIKKLSPETEINVL